MPLTLTKDDQAAIGAVVTNWTLAEMEFERLIGFLAHNTSTQLNALAPNRIVSFSKKIDVAKKLVSATCPNHSELSKVAKAIFTNSKVLANERKVAAHWTPTRDGPDPEFGIRFVDMGIPWSMPLSVTWHLTDLQEIAEDIEDLHRQVAQLGMAFFDRGGPLASLCTWHGPRSDVRFLDLAASHTTPRKRPTPTKGTP